MIDVQNQPDDRNTPINKVGVKNLRYPIRVLDRKNRYQDTVATINMYVDLPHDTKGTHMSRFVEMWHELKPDLSLRSFSSILDQMKTHLSAQSSHVEIIFPYFIEKKAPVSKSPGLMEYTCRMLGTSDAENKIDLVLEVIVPVTSVCPCSKEISDFGAHNQRGEVKLSVRFERFVWIEDMIELVESSASCDVYSVLKRVDEKYVTEHAHENPKFVEDIVRDVAIKLKNDTNISWFSVSAENFESIHNHSAFALITSGPEKPPYLVTSARPFR
ncbi:MAG: GTP cyclohydrolase FolE2 [Thermodesulfobacteriota bacterium]